MISTFLVRYQPPDLQSYVDDDVAQAVEALAATYETASRGLIYEHRPVSNSAWRLSSALKPLLMEAAGEGPGSAFERDAAVVLRRIQEASREIAASAPGNSCAFLELLKRLSRTPEATPGSAASRGSSNAPGSPGSPGSPGRQTTEHDGDSDPPRLIVL